MSDSSKFLLEFFPSFVKHLFKKIMLFYYNNSTNIVLKRILDIYIKELIL